MCQPKEKGGKRCVHDSSGTRTIAYEAERGYGFPAKYIKKVVTAFRKEAIHNGISDTEEAPQEEVEEFVEERKESIEANEKMDPAEKRTAIRGWVRALKEKVSMATLHSWKKVAAIMVAGSILTFASACTRAEEKVPEPTPETTQSQTVGPTDSTTVDKDKDKNKGTDQISTDGPFGYDFSNIPISDNIKEQYGKKASANILKDAFTPMEIMSTTTNIYAKGEKSSDDYLPLKAHMTPEGWERDSKQFDKDEGGSVFPAMVLNCDTKGQTPILKKGKEGNDDPENYSKLNCDEAQPIDNTKLLDLKVGTYKSEKDDKQFVDIPQHVTVSGTKKQTYTGTDSKGEPQWQTMNVDFTLYMVPDAQKKDHWLVDTAGWSYGYGESSYNAK